MGLLLLLLPDMEPLTLLISQSDDRGQTSLFMLDSSGLELICDAPKCFNLRSHREKRRAAERQIINQRDISVTQTADLIEMSDNKKDWIVSRFPETRSSLRAAGDNLDGL